MQIDRPASPLDPELVLTAYTRGVFPMAESRDDPEVHWVCPDPRAILPIAPHDPAGAFHVRRSLAKALRKQAFSLSLDRAFARVVAGCAAPGTAPGSDREDTWINRPIEAVFNELHRLGVAHSVEAWQTADIGSPPDLVGGLYGLALGGAFFAESMFSRVPYASQVCLVELVKVLRQRGFTLLDTQFVNPHLEQFGVAEVGRPDYLRRLGKAIRLGPRW
ncbi:MAG: leucyl/phenylalanyl-tRNA--protein transferase [Planctomycetota bacterium]